MNQLSLPPASLLAAVICLAAAGCSQPQAQNTVPAEELERAQKARLTLENEVKMLREDFSKKYEEALKQAEELQKSNDELKQQVEKAQDETDKVRKDLQEHMAKYRVGMRLKAKGTTYPRIEAADQKVYENVTVTEVTEDTVNIQHSGGVARVPLEKLTPQWQKAFFYDAEEIKAREAAKVAAAEAEKNPLAAAESEIPKEVAKRVDPYVLNRYRSRIAQRMSEISRLQREAREVKDSRYGTTSLAKLRLETIARRTVVLKDEIKALQNELSRAAKG